MSDAAVLERQEREWPAIPARGELPIEEASPPTTLREALSQLEINPIPLDRVRAHKRQTVRKGRSLIFFLFLPSIISGTGLITSFFCWIICIAATAVCLVGGFYSDYLASFTGAFLDGFFISYLMFIYFLIGCDKGTAVWRRTLFYRHEEVVPEEARRIARSLQRELPGVKLLVEWCGKDPFLVAKHKGQTEYLFLWGE